MKKDAFSNIQVEIDLFADLRHDPELEGFSDMSDEDMHEVDSPSSFVFIVLSYERPLLMLPRLWQTQVLCGCLVYWF